MDGTRRELAPGYDISRIVHGGWQFSAGHRMDGPALDDAVELLVASADVGVTTFDCADIYTGVEELFGRFLARWRTTGGSPVPIQVHTKLVPDWDALPTLRRRDVEAIVDRSRARLGVEALDLVQFYWWRDDVPGIEEAALWLVDLQAAGKIRYLGVTNLDVDRVRRLQDAGVPLVANQVQYSVLDRRPEAALARHCVSAGVGLLCYGGLAGGFLTDRWLGAADPGFRPANRSLVKYRLIVEEAGGWDAHQRLLAALRDVADGQGADVATVALRFVLDQEGVAACVVGATRPGQIARCAGALSLELGPDDHAHVRAALAGTGPAGPVFGLERDREGRHGRIMRYDLNRESR